MPKGEKGKGEKEEKGKHKSKEAILLSRSTRSGKGANDRALYALSFSTVFHWNYAAFLSTCHKPKALFSESRQMANQPMLGTGVFSITTLPPKS